MTTQAEREPGALGGEYELLAAGLYLGHNECGRLAAVARGTADEKLR